MGNYISKSSAQSNNLIWKHATIVIRIEDRRILNIKYSKYVFSTLFPHKKEINQKTISHSIECRTIWIVVFFVFIWKIVCDFVEFVACHITAVIISCARQSLLTLFLSLSLSARHPISFDYLQHRSFNRNHNRNRNIQNCFPFFPIHLAIDFNRCAHLLTSPFLLHS